MESGAMPSKAACRGGPLLVTGPALAELGTSDVLAEIVAETERGRSWQGDRHPAAAEGSQAVRPIPLWTLLDMGGADFVTYLYAELLGRAPDPRTVASLEARLADGTISKIEVVGQVRYSAEGRRMNRKVTGLLPRYLARKAYAVPVLGRLARLCVSILRLPGLALELRQATAALADCQARLAKLERQAGSAPAVQARLQQTDARLAALEASLRPAGRE